MEEGGKKGGIGWTGGRRVVRSRKQDGKEGEQGGKERVKSRVGRKDGGG